MFWSIPPITSALNSTATTTPKYLNRHIHTPFHYITRFSNCSLDLVILRFRRSGTLYPLLPRMTFYYLLYARRFCISAFRWKGEGGKTEFWVEPGNIRRYFPGGKWGFPFLSARVMDSPLRGRQRLFACCCYTTLFTYLTSGQKGRTRRTRGRLGVFWFDRTG